MFEDYQLRTKYFFQSLILRNRGYHATIQRLEILDFITQHGVIQKTSLANQLINQGISSSTTYTALKLFTETGLVREILINHHIHLSAAKFINKSPLCFTCEACKQTWLYKNKRLNDSAHKHFKNKSHKTMHITLTATGLCTTCDTDLKQPIGP